MKVKKQREIKDCGLMVLQAIHKHYYSKLIEINDMKLNANFGANGININNLIILGKKYGIAIEAFEVNLSHIKESMLNEFMICIIKSQGMNHYVIIKHRGKSVTIWDSINGKYTLSIIEFEKIYVGISMIFSKCTYSVNYINSNRPFNYLYKNINIVI